MNEYPSEWPKIAVEAKEAVGWRCVRCGHPDPPSPESGSRRGLGPCDEHCRHDREPIKQRVLTVHHLDGDKANCEPWNLAPLCQVCHLQIQAKVNMRQGFLFPELHSAWFMPFLNGYMAAHAVEVTIVCERPRRHGIITPSEQRIRDALDDVNAPDKY